MILRVAPLFFVLALFQSDARALPLDDLAQDFWAWRTVQQPLSGDDIPRLDRPTGWTPDFSKAAIAKQREALAGFEARWKALEEPRAPVARQVDYRLIGSALARVHWELDVRRDFERDPGFYIHQTLGAVFLALLQPPPFDASRSADLLKRLQSIPRTVESAQLNLEHSAVRPFAALAISALDDVRPRLMKVASEVKPLLAGESAPGLDAAVADAAKALESYRAWLESRLPTMSTETAVGRDAYLFFLGKVALLPYSPEQMLAMGEQEWERSVAFESYERNRNVGTPPLALFPDAATQIERGRKDEIAIRKFMEAKRLFTIPTSMGHYRNLPLPGYAEPLRSLGVADDLTSPARLGQDGISYIRAPSPTLGYFDLSRAHDPRPLIVHEGVPGHFFQMTLSWAHQDPICRHYYDSGANEGIGFYAEEMMLQAGLFDDSPPTREVIYNFMRLRALRVEVDIKLALGQFTIPQAAEYLQKTVPMDAETAGAEAAFFAAEPGQAISYQIGKLQIIKFLAEMRRAQGEKFDLRAFHDSLWKNGNVPIALQRWEALGLTGEIAKLNAP